MKKIRKGNEFWVCLDDSWLYVTQRQRERSSILWSEEDLMAYCKNVAHPKRYIKVRILESSAPWSDHEEEFIDKGLKV